MCEHLKQDIEVFQERWYSEQKCGFWWSVWAHLRAFFSQHENQDVTELQIFRREITHKVNGICVRVCKCIHTCEKKKLQFLSCENKPSFGDGVLPENDAVIANEM